MPGVASPPVPHWQHYSFSAHEPFAEDDEDAIDAAGPLPLRYLSGQIDLSVAWAAQPAQKPERSPHTLSSHVFGRLRQAEMPASAYVDPDAIKCPSAPTPCPTQPTPHLSAPSYPWYGARKVGYLRQVLS